MAFQKSNGTTTPHATSHSDLLDKLITFVTANGWTLHYDGRGTTGFVVLKSTGSSGTDAIYVSISLWANAGLDTYAWNLNGYTAYNSGVAFELQPGSIPNFLPCMPLWNDTTPYWFFVNNRRIKVVARIGTTYMSCYLGYILPYGTPGQWAYPLLIGGSNYTDALYSPPRYSDNSNKANAYLIPSSADNVNSQLAIRDNAGVWVKLYNSAPFLSYPNSTTGLYTARGTWPYIESIISGGVSRLRPNLDGKPTLMPIRLCRADTPDLLGILDDVKFVNGYGLSPEDTLTVGSDTYHVFQNTFRNSQSDFFAVKQ